MRLYPFQVVGRDYLATHRRAYLGDDPGLGKTPQALTAAGIVAAERPLVICPAIARSIWRRTWEALGHPTPTLTVLSYDECRLRGVEYCRALRPDLVILDEAHYCSNPAAKRTRVALKVANRAPRVWFLSGTPMRNHPGELYPMLRAVWPDLLERYGVETREKYTEFFCTTIRTDYGIRVLPKVKHPEVLREIVQQVMLRRRLVDVHLDLPPLRWETAFMEMDEEAEAVCALRELLETGDYDGVREMLEAGELPPDSLHIATLRRVIGTAKAPEAAAMIAEELEWGVCDKVVVLAYHHDVLDLLNATLQRFGLVRVDGSTTPLARERAEYAFQTNRATRVFLGQISAAGTAITLTAGHEIVMVEQMWTPADNFQAVKRIHRIGQDKPCRARVCVMPGSIDEQVGQVLLRKLAAIGEVIHL